VIGLTAFLTVVDLFATQAILPSLAHAFQVAPAAIGFAVNASTIGTTVAGLAVALASPRIDRWRGILVSLVALAVPTALLAVAPRPASPGSAPRSRSPPGWPGGCESRPRPRLVDDAKSRSGRCSYRGLLADQLLSASSVLSTCRVGLRLMYS